MKHLFSLVLVAALAACGASEQLVTSPQVKVAERISSSFRSIEVLEVSLPAYAAGEEVALEDEGELVLSDALWADDPTRAVTLSLTRNLKEITRSRVASEPWPFSGRPAARVDVRVEQLLFSNGNLRLSGQYFVVDLEERGRDHAHLFDLSTPIEEFSAKTAATGRADLIAKLARAIAKDAL